MRVVVGFLVGIALLFSPASAAETARQQSFTRAMTMIESGNSSGAAQVLDALYAETREPRVRLELARAYLLADDLSRARETFIAAYDDNPPPPVKARILQFIDQIDRRMGKVSFGVSITHAQNPYRLPNQFGVNFGGSYLTLDQNPKQRNVYGLVYSGSFEKQIGEDNDVKVQGSLRDLENGGGDFGFVDASAGQRLGSLPMEVRVGFQHLEMRTQSYRLPYVETAYRFSASNETSFVPRLQIGSYQPRSEQGLTGALVKLTLPIEISFNAHRSMTFGIKAERRTASFAEQAYWTVGPYFEANVGFEYFSVATSVALRTSNYLSVDPFWNTRRRDRSLYAAMVFESDRLRLGGMAPSLGFYCDANRSTVAYYKASDCGVLTNLRKLY